MHKVIKDIIQYDINGYLIRSMQFYERCIKE